MYVCMMDVELPCHQKVSVVYGAWLGHDVTITSLEQENIFSRTYNGRSWSILLHQHQKPFHNLPQPFILITTLSNPQTTLEQPSINLKSSSHHP